MLESTLAEQIVREMGMVYDLAYQLAHGHVGIPNPWQSRQEPIEILDRLRPMIEGVLAKLPKKSNLRARLEALHLALFPQHPKDERFDESTYQVQEILRALPGELLELEYLDQESVWYENEIRRNAKFIESDNADSATCLILKQPKRKGNVRAERKTEKSQKILPKLPQNYDVLRLAKRIKKEYGVTARSMTEIALDFADNDPRKAANLLRQLRTYRHLLD
jgi:hypothetical protein